MNVEFAAILASLRGVLRNEVAPELQSDHARTQTFAVIDVLDKIAQLADWAPDMLDAKLARLAAGMARFREEATALGLTPPEAPGGDAPTDQAERACALAAGNAEVVTLTDWLFDLDAPLAQADRRRLLMILRDTIQAEQAEERKLIALSDFAASS